MRNTKNNHLHFSSYCLHLFCVDSGSSHPASIFFAHQELLPPRNSSYFFYVKIYWAGFDLKFSQFELKRIQVFCDQVTIKSSHADLVCGVLGIGYRIDDLSVIFYENKPTHKLPNSCTRTDLIRSDYDSSNRTWKIQYKNKFGQWHIYQPLPIVDRFEYFIAEIDLFITNRLILLACR